MQQEENHLNEGKGSEGENEQEDYYGNFARRVYFLADEEGWDNKKTMSFFNDKQAFEKYYSNVSQLTPFQLVLSEESSNNSD